MTATSVDPIADAVLALIPGTVYHGKVGDGAEVPAPPWAHVTIGLPAAAERGGARAVHLRSISVRVLVYGLTADSVRVKARTIDAALEGARPTITGWRTTPLEQVNERAPIEDRDVTIAGSNAHPLYGVLEYLFTASREG